ncbi:hypothetical protein GCM10017655_13820 [Pseudomonas turukhanskensis]|uniref:Uncharacterized protein n=2 Tax=Pseudomonas turukhanskensis TaxID=1806536 RepID=A0A9W6K2G6_9PSED|nr:hypothetical protein GCM10017655_13820 [Pseudomonas turukhanskensis]
MVGRRAVEVRPVQLRHFEIFAAAAAGLIALLADSSTGKILAYAKNTAALTAIIGACTTLPVWRARRLPAAVVVQLMVVVVKENSDFFNQALQVMASHIPGSSQSND